MVTQMSVSYYEKSETKIKIYKHKCGHEKMCQTINKVVEK